jgi:hypothetical protein
VLGDLVGDDDLLPGGPGEVPRVDQELDGQDAQGGAGGHLGSGACCGTEVRDRSDQVVGQLGHVELGAHRGLMVVGFGDAAQDRSRASRTSDASSRVQNESSSARSAAIPLAFKR